MLDVYTLITHFDRYRASHTEISLLFHTVYVLCISISAIGELDVVSFTDVTTNTDFLRKEAVFELELGPITGLRQHYLNTYDVHLTWRQASGPSSRTLHMSSCNSYSPDYISDGYARKVAQKETTYRIFVPIKHLGEGRLVVNLTINFYCIEYIAPRYNCTCSEWQLGWMTNSLEISAKRG